MICLLLIDHKPQNNRHHVTHVAERHRRAGLLPRLSHHTCVAVDRPHHRRLAERSVHLRSRRPDLTALVAVLLKATERFG